MNKTVTLTFHDAKTEKPSRSCEVIVVCKSGGVYQVGYSKTFDAFGHHDDITPPSDKRRETWSDVLYWAYDTDISDKIPEGKSC